MEEHNKSQTEGKRVGLHPAIVLFGVIIGLWLFITMIIPKSKNTKHPAGMPSQPVQPLPATALSDDVVPVFSTSATISELNIVNLVVPPATTDSQIGALINHLKSARENNTLADLIPATTSGDELGDFAIADIYIFSETRSWHCTNYTSPQSWSSCSQHDLRRDDTVRSRDGTGTRTLFRQPA